ncbi:MAG: ABC transporter ATP-binding protein [Lachnospiraceae bacterium]|nr:ABC transporter ATP-binding protein [Lachnospiraceae bacterium]
MAKEKKGISLRHIAKIYQDPKTGKDFYAVKDTSLEIEPGSFVTLLGPSGCGKTTTLRMIAGFESPDEGEIYLGGEPINDLTPNKRDTAMVFQSYALLPHYNVYDNVAYGLKLRKLDKETIRKKVTDILKLVGLEGREGRMTNQLSGGQQQRVALARALVLEPGVLLFDEPLSNLDAKLRVSMRTEIRRIQQEAGITAVYVTHDQSEAMAISDQIIVMNKGVVEQMGTPQEIYYRPKNAFVADFIGEANFLQGSLKQKTGKGGVVNIAGNDVPVKDCGDIEEGAACTLLLRPEGATLRDAGQLSCTVTLSCFMGGYQNYHVRVGENEVKITDFNPRNKKIYQVGDQAFVAFEPEDAYLMDKGLETEDAE